jgi:hypothetical protein
VRKQKSAFIRSLPITMSAGEVVERAKGHGLDISQHLVRIVRQRSSALTGPADARSTTARVAAYVRAHPDLSPEALVRQAKAEGIRLDVGYVSGVRAFASGLGAAEHLAGLIGLQREEQTGGPGRSDR